MKWLMEAEAERWRWKWRAGRHMTQKDADWNVAVWQNESKKLKIVLLSFKDRLTVISA